MTTLCSKRQLAFVTELNFERPSKSVALRYSDGDCQNNDIFRQGSDRRIWLPGYAYVGVLSLERASVFRGANLNFEKPWFHELLCAYTRWPIPQFTFAAYPCRPAAMHPIWYWWQRHGKAPRANCDCYHVTCAYTCPRLLPRISAACGCEPAEAQRV